MLVRWASELYYIPRAPAIFTCPPSQSFAAVFDKRKYREMAQTDQGAFEVTETTGEHISDDSPILPFDHSLDEENYVYRIQSRNSLRHMREAVGENLAPSRWNRSKHCPHREYVDIAASLEKNEAIYTLSVWRSEAAAWRNWPRSEKTNDCILIRIPRNALARTGLRCIDDDFLINDALLLYRVEKWEEGQVYGCSRIPWSALHQIQACWLPMQVDEEDLRGVGNPFSRDYRGGEAPSRDFNFDFGLPSDEIIIRQLLRHIRRVQSELREVPRWKFLNRREKYAEQKALDRLWFDLDRSHLRISAAIDRIASIIPHDKLLQRYLKSGKQSRTRKGL